MPEVSGAELEFTAIDFDRPDGRQMVAALPFVSAFAGKRGRGFAPFNGGKGRFPNRLGARTREHDGTKAFEFLKPAAVEELIV